MATKRRLSLSPPLRVVAHKQNNEQSAQGTPLLLDFSDLLPTPAQLASLNHPSTGNTPSSPSSSDSAYLPPMSPAALPAPQTPGTQKLIAFIDNLRASRTDVNIPLGKRDFGHWKDFVCDDYFTREELEAALTHVAKKIVKAERALRHREPNPSIEFEKGLVTGYPLTTVPWKALLHGDRSERMSGMALRSAVLQGCARLCDLRCEEVREESMRFIAGTHAEPVLKEHVVVVNPDEIEMDVDVDYDCGGDNETVEGVEDDDEMEEDEETEVAGGMEGMQVVAEPIWRAESEQKEQRKKDECVVS